MSRISPEHLREDPFLIASLLGEQLSGRKAPYGQRELGPGLGLALWLLRAYALFMLAVVLWQAWRVL